MSNIIIFFLSFYILLISVIGYGILFQNLCFGPIKDMNDEKVIYTGFIFGLVAYGTYNLTNMATVKGWSPTVVIVDMIWGGSLTAFSSFIGLLIAKKFFSS